MALSAHHAALKTKGKRIEWVNQQGSEYTTPDVC